MKNYMYLLTEKYSVKWRYVYLSDTKGGKKIIIKVYMEKINLACAVSLYFKTARLKYTLEIC